MNNNKTKGKIIETMYSLIAENGYEKASIGKIAATIGIKKASVYYYFKSKEDIFLKLVQEIYQDGYSNKMEIFSSEISVDEYKSKLIIMGEEFIDSYFENPDLRKVCAEIDIQATRIPSVKEFIEMDDENFNRFLMKCMIHGVKIGAFPKDFDTQLNAQILYTILIGIDQAILYDFPIKPKEVWREVVLSLFRKEVSSQ